MHCHNCKYSISLAMATDLSFSTIYHCHIFTSRLHANLTCLSRNVTTPSRCSFIALWMHQSPFQRPQDHKFISHVRNNFHRASASNPRFPWCDSNVRESVRDYQTWRPWACSKSSRHLDATFSLEHNRKPHRTGSWQARDQFNGKLAFSPAFVWVWPVWDVQQ